MPLRWAGIPTFSNDVSYEVKRSTMLQMNALFHSSPAVYAIVMFLIRFSCLSRWSVDIRKSGDDLKKKPWSDPHLSEQFANQMEKSEYLIVQYIVTCGCVVIYYTLEEGSHLKTRSGRDLIVNVLNPAECFIKWSYSKNNNKQYEAFVMDPESNQFIPLKWSRVYVFSEMRTDTSELMSPLLHALRAIEQRETLRALYDVGAYKNVIQPWVYRPNADKFQLPLDILAAQSNAPLNPSGPGSAPPTPYDFHRNFEFAVRDTMHSVFKELLNQTETDDTMHEALKQADPARTNFFEKFTDIAKSSIGKPTKTLPPGVEIDPNAPVPIISPQIVEMCELYKSEICAVLGVPVTYVFNESISVSANVVSSDKTVVTTANHMHKLMGEVFKRTFVDLYYGEILQKVEFKAEKKAIASVVKSVANLKPTEANKKLLVDHGFLLKSKFVNEALNQLTLTISFAAMTVATFADLYDLFVNRVIDFETFQQLSLAANFLPASMRQELTPAEVKKIFDKVAELFMALPEKEEGGAAGEKRPSSSKTKSPKRQKTSKDITLDDIEKSVRSKQDNADK